MRTYEIELIGHTPALMHADDVLAADALKDWRVSPDNKDLSVAGDDRSPPWTYQTYLYHDGEHLAVPQENLMACLRKAGERIPKGKSNYKALTQVGLLMMSDFCDLTSNGRQYAISEFLAIKDRPFSEQFAAVRDMGLELKVKRAKVGQAKHVRVRLMLKNWKVRGTLAVTEPAINDKVLEQLFEIAGRYVGLFDWRPSSPKSPGPYGIFKAKLTAASATLVA